ncbi:Similar to stac: Protein unc-13 homolog 4B (Drosophila melanogaster) [Cotesia congregata]|uniref:Similar to stac: Protein unc-13 homolog 4B (Drosophila melanogaster) n=1 Tax=Cotesia congregata TaxID=51543 RepID=A0A8J2MGL1_COTCN|nr:Similar to stac: Protein unc-13 homolog 4B (Drosophila melanogaster) [Cotesia congregata]
MTVCLRPQYKMAHFAKCDTNHPYYAIAAFRMTQKPENRPVTVGSIYWKFVAHNFIHKRIQDSDGGFFENLGTLLAEKVRAQELAEGPLPIKSDKSDEEEDVVGEGGSIEEPTEALLESDSDRDENERALDIVIGSVGWNIEELYTALVYMTQHQIGYDVTNECGREALLNHLQQAFKVDFEVHSQVVEETQSMEAPVMHLNVEVIEAKELISKDSNGKSDPFCALYLESAPTRRYNTAVKTMTLAPVWEEHFELPLEDADNDTLCLEVWDFDAAETVPEKMSKVKDVKGVRGLVKLAKEIAVTATTGSHDNEFIGRCKIPLKDIPVTGHTTWYSLEKKNKSKRRGVVRLRLAFSAEHNTQVAAQEHRHLVRILLLHELETEKVEKYCWCGRWSAPAEALILQHSAQRGLLARNVFLSQWVEYSRIHQQHPLHFAVFNKVAVELLRPLENGLFSKDEEKLFWDATKKIIYSCLNSIRKIRRLSAGDKNVMTQMGAILGILSSISSLRIPDDFDLFPQKMFGWFPEPEDIKVDVMKALEYSVIQASDSDDDALKYQIKVIQLIRADLQRAMEIYDRMFIKKINFPYARTLYIMYEKRISDMCMVIIEDVCLRLKRIEVDSTDEVELTLGTTLFELYLTLQRYAMLSNMFCLDGIDHMKIQSYHEWFRAGVSHWLDISVYKALKRIERAVEFDTLQPVDSSVQYSSSAVDTLTIFYQIKVFWTQLAWPDVEGSYTFIAKIIDDICKCTISYADMMASKAEKVDQQIQSLDNNSSVYDKKFEVSNAWCFAINNIDYIRTSIGPLTHDLGLQDIIDSLSENKTQQEADRCRQTLELLINNTMDTVKNKIIELLEVVANKMQPAMSRYLMEGAELIDTTSNAMDRLLQYLDTNITVLHDNLNEDNFERVLLVIWEIMSETLYKLVYANLEKRRPPSFYSNLNRTLHTLIRFFNLGADETSNVKILEKIERLLSLHGLETADLIHRYYLERAQQQKDIEETSHGMLTVRAQFISNSLNVQILNARNLRPMDSNGDLIGKLSTLERKLHSKSKQPTKRLKEVKTRKCDSYVKIRLLPEEKFCEVKLPKTHVQKETLFPLFDETVNIAFTPEQRNIENAILVFEVKDKDFLRTKFMAEAFLQFSDIPDTATDVIRALEHRKGDNQAMDFISKFNAKLNTR